MLAQHKRLDCLVAFHHAAQPHAVERSWPSSRWESSVGRATTSGECRIGSRQLCRLPTRQNLQDGRWSSETGSSGVYCPTQLACPRQDTLVSRATIAHATRRGATWSIPPSMSVCRTKWVCEMHPGALIFVVRKTDRR